MNALPQPQPSLDDEFAAIKQVVDSLSPGTVALEAPPEMRVNQPSTVTVRLAPKGESVGAITASMTTTVVEHVTPRMHVDLVASDMNATLQSPADQLVAGGGQGLWIWNVTPLHDGPKTISAEVYALVPRNGKEEPHHVATVPPRTVQVLPPHFSLGDWLAEHFEWVWGALLVPLAGAIWTFIQRRRKRDSVASTSGTPSANETNK